MPLPAAAVRAGLSGKNVCWTSTGRGSAVKKQDDEEPGASSGQEDQPHERTVPGSESAAEGYESDAQSGTREGDPIAGVETEPDEP